MPTTESEIVRGFAWEGPISVATAIAIFAVVAVAFAGLLWRERHAVGIRTATCFWILRLCAVAVVLWMLLAPTNLTRHIKRSPQSIAVLVDGSESMGIVDPSGMRDDIRWTLAAQEAPSGANTSSAGSFLLDFDRALVALRMAADHANQTISALELRRPLRITRLHFKSIVGALDRAVSHLQGVSHQLGDNETSLAGRAKRIRDQLKGPVRDKWAECDRALSSDQVVTSMDRSVQLASLSKQLTSSHRRLSYLVRDAADRMSDVVPPKDHQRTAKMSRSQKVAGVLGPLEEYAADKLENNIRIKRFRFAEIPTLVPDGSDWQDIIQPTVYGAKSASAGGNPAAAQQENEPTANGDGRNRGHIGPTTNITAALQHLSREAGTESIKSVYLISDGGHNHPDSPSPQKIAASFGKVPVYVVPIGNEKPLRDLIVHRVDAPTTVVQKDSIAIDAIVTAFTCKGEKTEAILERNGQRIDQQLLEFDRDRINRHVTFRVAAEKLGRHEFTLSLQPVDDEASTRNNVASLQVEVIKDKMQLLLAHRINHWEFQFLEQLFPRDKRIEFDHLRLEPAIHATGAIRESASLPRDVKEWSRYNTVILGDLPPDQLDRHSQESLEEYVRDRGGNLIVVAGRNNMPQAYAGQKLGQLLPVQLDRRRRSKKTSYQLDLTMEGRRNTSLMIEDTPEASQRAWQAIYRRLPIHFLSKYSRPKPSARTLIEAIPIGFGGRASRTDENQVDSAFLCWHNVGAGRVVFLAAPATYQLRYHHGDTYHHRFWGQLLRWVMASELSPGSDRLRIQTDKAQYVYGDHVQVSVRWYDEQEQPISDARLEVVARPTEGPETVVQLSPDRRVPGQYRGTIEGLLPGSYRLQPRGESAEQPLPDVESATGVINVSASESIEMLNTQCDRALLKQIAVATGGQVIPPTAMTEVLQLTELSPEVTERVDREPLWNRWRYLVVVFGCLACEWVIRKRLGLA